MNAEVEMTAARRYRRTSSPSHRALSRLDDARFACYVARSLADQPRPNTAEKGVHSMRTDLIAQLDKTLEPHLVRSADSDTPVRIYRELIGAAKAVSDRLGHGTYRFDKVTCYPATGSSRVARYALFGAEDVHDAHISIAEPYERPDWMDGLGYCMSIQKSYGDSLAMLIRKHLDGEGFMPKYRLFRLVRCAVDMALMDRLTQAFHFADGRNATGLPLPIAADLAENVLETLAFGLTFTLNGTSGAGYHHAANLAELARTFTCSVPLGISPLHDKWLVIIA
jgi:hypothetical protein